MFPRHTKQILTIPLYLGEFSATCQLETALPGGPVALQCVGYMVATQDHFCAQESSSLPIECHS
jgi:hypothetical protein